MDLDGGRVHLAALLRGQGGGREVMASLKETPHFLADADEEERLASSPLAEELEREELELDQTRSGRVATTGPGRSERLMSHQIGSQSCQKESSAEKKTDKKFSQTEKERKSVVSS